MPDLASLHPQVVHFVVAGLILGLPLYWLGFLRRLRWMRSTATLLLVVGTVASFVAVKTGEEAHGPAERIPGVRDAVVHHEELGERTRTVFAVILLVELAALVVAQRAGDRPLGVETEVDAAAAGASTRHTAAMALRVVVGLAWIFGAALLFEAAEHGGELVYEYGGGVGFQPGNPAEDVPNLLRAGLYHQSRLDREAGRREEAARLVEELVRRFPDDPEIALVGAESLVADRQDGRAALDALAAVPVADDQPRLLLRKLLYTADAYELLGMPDSARAALEGVPERYRQSNAVRTRLERLGGA